jgi:hypothetical protein
VLFVRADLLPAEVATAGDLARCIRWNYHQTNETAVSNAFQFAREQAWEKLVDICCRTLSVKPEQVTTQANFVRDLGLS